MITNTDCILLLSELHEQGNEEAGKLLNKIITKNTVDLDVLKFINDRRQLEVAQFYELLRKNYNKKKSTLYINIVKEIEEPDEVLTTLSALLTQILLFARKLDGTKILFLKHARANDITKVLNNYFSTYDITKAIQLLRLIKADLKALEHIK